MNMGLIVRSPSTVFQPAGEPVASGGAHGELIVGEFGGKYYHMALHGLLFHGTTLTASAIPIANSTAPTFGLWNPSDSGKNAILVRYKAGWAATTEVPGNILYAQLSPAGSVIATAAPISANTLLAPTNGIIGGGLTSKMRFGTSFTLTAAGAVYATSGMSHLTTTGAAITQTGWQLSEDFDGMTIVAPGTLWYTVASAATASTYNQTLVWYELPVVNTI